MKKTLVISIICLLNCTLSYAQNLSKESKKVMNNAENKFLIEEDYFGAIQLYKTIYKEDSLDKLLNYRMGVCSYHLKMYDESEAYFEKSSSTVSYEIFRYKASLAHINMKFKKAINYYNGYKLVKAGKDLTEDEINHLINKVIYAEQAIKNPLNVVIENVGSPISTEHDEYVPLISGNEEMMLFTSRRPGSTGGLLDHDDRHFEDIYVSYKDGNAWGNPKKLREGINTATNDACVGLSSDGQGLHIFRTSEDLFTGNLYECKMEGDDWGDPVLLSDNINSEYVESSAVITIDNETLYFSSDREGGFGGKDLYKAKRLPNGEWAKPTNLGATINTPYNEDAPFIHSNGKTLYFSSTGHQNIGGYDVFKTDFNDDTWGIPINLGYPINTVKDDIFFVLAANEKVGYYSSSKQGGNGGQDIYRVILKEDLVQSHVLKGSVLNRNDEPILAKITLIEDKSKTIQGVYNTREQTGKFIMILNPGNTYNIIIEAENHYSMTSKLNFDVNNEDLVKFKLDQKE